MDTAADFLTQLTAAQEAMEQSLVGGHAVVAELHTAQQEVLSLKKKYKTLRRFVGTALLTELQRVVSYTYAFPRPCSATHNCQLRDESDDEISMLTTEGTTLNPNVSRPFLSIFRGSESKYYRQQDFFDQVINSLRFARRHGDTESEEDEDNEEEDSNAMDIGVSALYSLRRSVPDERAAGRCRTPLIFYQPLYASASVPGGDAQHRLRARR